MNSKTKSSRTGGELARAAKQSGAVGMPLLPPPPPPPPPLPQKQSTKSATASSSSSSSSSSSTSLSSSANEDFPIRTNMFLNEFFDCIENLPNKLQLLLTELRNVDALVKARHRKLQSIKQQLFNSSSSSSSSSTSTGDVNQTSANEGDVDQRRPADNYQLLSKLYQLLVECQNLGDHKVRITNQIIECISSKTRQLGFDSKLNEKGFNFEIDEEKILNDFKKNIRIQQSHANSFNSNPFPSNNNVNTSNSATTTTGYRFTSRNYSNQNLQPKATNSRQNNNNTVADAGKLTGGKYYLYNNSRVNNNNNNNNNLTNNGSMASQSQTNLSQQASNTVTSYTVDAYSFDEKSNGIDNASIGIGVTSYSGKKKTLRSLTAYASVKHSSTANIDSSSNNETTGAANSASGSNGKRLVKKIKLDFNSSNETPVKNKNVNSNKPISTRPKRQLNTTTANNAQTTTKSEMSKYMTNKLKDKEQTKRDFKRLTKTTGQLNHKANTGKRKERTAKLNNHRSEEDDSEELPVIRSDDIDGDISLSNDEIDDFDHDQSSESMDDQPATTTTTTTTITTANTSTTNHNNPPTTHERVESNPTLQSNNDPDEHQTTSPSLANTEPTKTTGRNSFKLKNFDTDSDQDTSFTTAPTTTETKTVNGDDAHDRNSNETESINHIDDDDENDDDDDDEEPEHFDDSPSPTNSEPVKKTRQQTVANSEPLAFNNVEVAGNNTVVKKTTSSLNEDEPVYCLCREISYGQMIMCDNDACKIEWFHFKCVKLSSKPKGKWYCPQCRGDNHRVMKKSQASAAASSSPSYFPTAYSSYSNRNK